MKDLVRRPGGAMYAMLPELDFRSGRCVAWAHPDVDGWQVRDLRHRPVQQVTVSSRSRAMRLLAEMAG